MERDERAPSGRIPEICENGRERDKATEKLTLFILLFTVGERRAGHLSPDIFDSPE